MLKTSARDFFPERLTLPALGEAAQHCRGCELYQRATQVVFGEGPRNAAVMLIGEVPGDREDKEGRPFVGPAGKLLDGALAEIGLNRQSAYVTNAVKHFSWEERGKRRLHKKPHWRHVQACKPWLEAEIAAVGPRLIVCLGATAAQALLGPTFRITRERGRLIDSPLAPFLTTTYHPSAILRAPEKDVMERMRTEFIEDLRQGVRAAEIC